jgi:hypothetical protein
VLLALWESKSEGRPRLTRTEIHQKIGYSPGSGTANAALDPIKSPTRGKQRPGLVRSEYVKKTESGRVEHVYEITPAGEVALIVYLAKLMPPLPSLAERRKKRNVRYMT